MKEMKERGRAFVGYTNDAAVNLLYLAEEMPDTVREGGVEPAVLRGIAYGMGIAQAVALDPRGFGKAELASIVDCAARCEDAYAGGGAAGAIALMTGDEDAANHIEKEAVNA